MPLEVPPTRVALVDEHEIASIALLHVLNDEPDFEFAGCHHSVAAFRNAIAESPATVDLVLVDVVFASSDDTLEELGAVTSLGVVLVGWTSTDHPFLERRLRGAGATAIISRSGPVEAIIGSLRALASHPDSSHPARTRAPGSPVDPVDPRLSTQEQRVLALVAEGRTLQSVAFDTGLAYGTVEDYVRRIRAKYERAGRPARTRIDLLARAVEDGLLLFPPRG